MRTVLLASMRRHTRRYVAATVAVVIGVAFIVVTNALASAAKDGMTSGLDAPYENADVVVTDIDGDQAAKLLALAERKHASAAVLGWAWLPVSRDGTEIGNGADVGALAADEAQRWQELVDGRFPASDEEAVVDANAAKSNDVGIGDVLTIGSGKDALDVEVVGTVDSPSSMVWSAVYLTQDAQARWLDRSLINSVAWRGPGSTEEQQDALTAAVPDARVLTVDEFIVEQQKAATNGVDVIAIVLLLFAAIAIGTSVMVIANTFSILFAQRTRDFALLRCVGATKHQVVRSIRLEALVLGVVSAGLGLAIGAAVGLGVVALVRGLWPGARVGEVAFSPLWFAGAAVVGVAVTLAAAWLPTRRATRVSPLAALRPDTGMDVRTSSGRVRVALGVVLVLAGVLAMAAAIVATSLQLMVLGGGATFFGVVVLGPTLVPALIRVAGSVTARVFGSTGRLATSNAVRNPRRTAATTASLLVGVTLTTAVLSGLASGRSIIDEEMATDHPIDATVSASDATGLDDDLLRSVQDMPGVEDAVAVPGTVATVDHGVGELPVVAPGDVAGLLRSDPDFASPGSGEIYLPASALVDGAVPGRVTVTVGDRSRTLTTNVGEDWGNVAVVAPETLAELDATAAAGAIWIRADLDTDAEDFSGDLTALASGAGGDVDTALAKWAVVDLQLDVLTGAVVGLLAIAVVIALVGIANTLGLSVLERGRENALLRALGLTRRQLRATLATEAVLLSVVATLLGTALGVAFAWVGVQTMLREYVEEVSLTLPFGQLAIVVLVSAGAGLLACVLPARRAARTTPAAGLTLE